MDLHFRSAGYTADLSLLQKHPGFCPLCERTDTRSGTLSAVGVAEAGMTYIPYTVCEECTSKHYIPALGGFSPENGQRIETAIFTRLGIAQKGSFISKLPERFHDMMATMISTIGAEGMPVHPGWLQHHTYTCPGCGQETAEPAKVGVSITESRTGAPVAVPYLVCPSCSRYSDEQLSKLAYDRIRALIEGRHTAH